MNILDVIRERHSVRSYKDEKIDEKLVLELEKFINELNRESGLKMQLVLNEPTAFSGLLAKYGKFENANNYIAIVGKNDENLDEACGYYGEKIVLYAQGLRLNSCWVASSYSKGKLKEYVKIGEGEKLRAVIAVGYGATNGKPSKTKVFEDVTDIEGEVPSWFDDGIEMALLAPSALNQQRFEFSLDEGKVVARKKFGRNTEIDLGIAKLHFELGAGKDNFKWKEEKDK